MRLLLGRVCGRMCVARCVGQEDVRYGVKYQVRRAGRNGFIWVGAEDLLDVVVKAYEMSRGERAGTEVGSVVA
jgi:hypothetical protein